MYTCLAIWTPEFELTQHERKDGFETQEAAREWATARERKARGGSIGTCPFRYYIVPTPKEK